MIIITVNYNRPKFLEVQLELIRKNLQPEAIHVINTGDHNNGCKEIAACYDAKYTHMTTGTRDFSQSHALALNVGYSANRQLTDIIGILDHDCFPIAPVDVPALMEGKTFYATNQEREGKVYPNPACLFIRTEIGALDFMPCAGMDTGGQLWKVYDNIQPMTYEPQEQFEIFGGAFLHIVKGSNWVQTSDNQGRVDRVFNCVKKFI